jgi:hypothetical protein
MQFSNQSDCIATISHLICQPSASVLQPGAISSYKHQL